MRKQHGAEEIQIVVSDMARSLALVLCLAAAPSACALSSRRRVTPAFPHVGQMHSRTATGLTTVMELRGGSLLSEHQLLSYVAYAVASTAAAGSAIALIGALAVLGWVKKPILSESGTRSRRWRSSGSRCLSSQQPMRPPTTPEAPPARTGLPSGWAGRAYRSGADAGCGGALPPAHRRRPRSFRTAQVSEGEGAIAAAVSRARGEADSPCGVLVEMSTQPRLPAYEALTRSPTPRHPLLPSTDPANTARGRCEGHAYDGLLSMAGCSFLIYPSRRCDSRRWRRRGTR